MDVKVLQLIASLHKRIPLTTKMVLIVVIIGIILWKITDYYQFNYHKSIHEVEHKNMINHVAVEQRMRFDNYVKKYFQSVKLFAAQKKFNDYMEFLEKKKWTEDKNIQVKYHSQPPQWLPARSIIRTFIPAHYFILSDGKGRLREVYSKENNKLPEFFLKPDSILYQLSQNQSFLTLYDKTPYIIASRRIPGKEGQLAGTLTLACPIDDKFLIHSQGVIASKSLVALITGLDPYIIASNHKNILPVGEKIDALRDRFMVAEEGFFDYGNSDLLISLATFFPIAEIASQNKSILYTERVNRTITIFIFIMTFAMIVYWITRHIQKITQQISTFSQETLGMKPEEVQKGDQLYILKERFRNLTEEVLVSRETLKRQANEQTRLIVNSAFDAIVTTDDNGKIKSWNPQAETIFGWTSEEAVGRIINDTIVSAQHRETFKKTLEHFMKTGKWPVFNELIVITACHCNGHEFTAEFSVSPAWSGDNYIFIFIIRDVTERKQAENKIKDLLSTVTKAKTEWETTFDSVTELILIMDKELNIIRCNKRFAEFTEKSINEVIGGKCSDFLICGRELNNIKHNDQIKNEPERTEFETEDGRWLYVTHLPVFDEKGEFLNTVITATDITELKRIEQSLTESRAELNERIDDLENFYEMAVNRELKMIELKKEIIRLKDETLKNNPVEI
jgi:PAS domain S-box-containing protein